MKKYILKINTEYLSPDASSSEFKENYGFDKYYLQLAHEFENPGEVGFALNEFGYDPENFDIQSLIENGGEYSGLGDVEWGVDVVDVEEEKIIFNKDLTIEQFLEKLREELNIYIQDKNYSNNDFENAAFETAEGFLTQSQLDEIAEYNLKATQEERISNLIDKLVKYKLPDSELEESFNQAEEFVKQYRDYLIGKKLLTSKKVYTISDIKATSDDDSNKYTGDIDVMLDNGDDFELIKSEDFQRFIDGEDVVGINNTHIMLNLQEEKEEQKTEEKSEEKINQPDYKYYIINIENNKFLEGFEYREDANERAQELESYGQKVNVFSKKAPNIADPNDNNNWSTDKHDWAIIEEAFKLAVNTNDLTQDEANKYLNDFKNNGLYLHVIKSRLLTYLKECQNSTRNSLANSKIEKAKQLIEYCTRTEKELMKILSMEK